jgi:hypothetical protein
VRMGEDKLQNEAIKNVFVSDKAKKLWSSGKFGDEFKQIRKFVLANNTESGIVIIWFFTIQLIFEERM